MGHDRIGRRRDDGVSCGKGLGQGLRSWQTGEGGSFRRTQVRDDGEIVHNSNGLAFVFTSPSWPLLFTETTHQDSVPSYATLSAQGFPHRGSVNGPNSIQYNFILA